MLELDKQEVIDSLLTEWASYVEDFEGLDDAARQQFLESQGYENFHDLLAHVVGWWEEAIRVITSIMDGEPLPPREYNIDEFNEVVIREYKSWKNSDLVLHYENLRNALLNLIADLPEGGFSNQRVAGWLHACVVEHASEHKLPARTIN